VDLSSPGADIVADIRSLPIAGNSIHFILCSHVLEHVENDASALRELLRVLVPEGVALILVPTRPGSKFENPEITAAGPESRLKHYGHPDHVRWYGDDTRDWFASQGFDCEAVKYATILGREIADLHALSGETIFACTKPRGAK
jgi:SAM-dependent methyltransferase